MIGKGMFRKDTLFGHSLAHLYDLGIVGMKVQPKAFPIGNVINLRFSLQE